MRTVEERAARGKRARKLVPRTSHAQCPATARDVVARLQADDVDRVQDLVPIRYGRMARSPFSFYRGSAAVMAADLAELPASGLETQLCGDAHLANFGVFRSPERRMVFDLNDFDETLPGPFEWDVKRLAASLELAGRDNGHDFAARRKTVLAAVRTYRRAMRDFAGQGNLAVWYAHVDVDKVMATMLPRVRGSERERAETTLARARQRDSRQVLRKLTTVVDGQPRFVSRPPLMQPLDELFPGDRAAELQARLQQVLTGYRETLPGDRRHLFDQFALVDVARRVVGVGSVGTRAWVLLLSGRDAGDPLVLQAKEPGPSVLEAHLGASKHEQAGERVVAGQRLMQAASDIFLGWQRVAGLDGVEHDYYVRQLRDGKASADVAGMRPRVLRGYGEVCAWTLARAHARAGDRVAIAAYLGRKDTFDRAVADFAEAYAERVQDQFGQLEAAVRSGRVQVS